MEQGVAYDPVLDGTLDGEAVKLEPRRSEITGGAEAVRGRFGRRTRSMRASGL